jgi:predicted AAA+ superfamily ATPase
LIDLARLSDPLLTLQRLDGLVVLDEVQRLPGLFPVLRVLADRPDAKTRFLLLGSASPELLQQSSESLAGRIAYHALSGFSLDEVGADARLPLWVRGGFPRSFLADGDEASLEWRMDFIRSFLERDLGLMGFRIPAVVRQLQPWFENLGKRQVKTPKVLVNDTGLLHALLGLESYEDLAAHPKIGASWEGFAGSEVIRCLGARPDECYFWRTHAGAELDLLVVRGRRKRGFEFKYTVAPATTRSMHTAVDDLGLDHLDVIYAGSDVFRLSDRIRAVPLQHVAQSIEPL